MREDIQTDASSRWYGSYRNESVIGDFKIAMLLGDIYRSVKNIENGQAATRSELAEHDKRLAGLERLKIQGSLIFSCLAFVVPAFVTWLLRKFGG